MSTEFSLWRISPECVKALQDFGEPAFDLLWESDLVDDDDFWTENKIQEDYFSDGKSYFQDFPRDLMLTILSEGCEISRSLDKSFSVNGNFVEGIHFLLAGKRQFYRHDFIVKEVSLPDEQAFLTLANVLVGMREAKEEAGLYASYLTADEVEAAVKVLPNILNDDFDMRWKRLQEMDQGSEYLRPYHQEPWWTEEIIESIKRSRQAYKERLRRSFSESFHPEEPRQFLHDELFPFLVEASRLGCGLLASRSY